MVELKAIPSGCCAPARQDACCEPHEKPHCCEPERASCACEDRHSEPKPGLERARAQVSPAFTTLFDENLVAAHERLVANPGVTAAKVAFVTIYHLLLEATLGLTTFEFSTRFMERSGLLPGFVAGYTRIHHDEQRHIGYGIWFLRKAVAEDRALGDVVRGTLRELLPAVAESLTPPEGADVSVLGTSAAGLRDFALGGLTRRLNIVGVPLETL